MKTAPIRIRRLQGATVVNLRRANASLEQACAASSRALYREPVFFDGCIHFYRKTKHQSSRQGKSQGQHHLARIRLRSLSCPQEEVIPPTTRLKQRRHLGIALKRGVFLRERLRQWDPSFSPVVAPRTLPGCVCGRLLLFFRVRAFFFPSFFYEEELLLLITRDQLETRDEAQPASSTMRRRLAEIQGFVKW